MAKLVGSVSLAELREAGRVRLSYPPFDVCVVWAEGDVYAIEDACNHAGASLTEGNVKDKCITCPMHGYVFSLESGELIAPRGLCGPQHTYRARIVGDDVVVEDVFELEVLG